MILAWKYRTQLLQISITKSILFHIILTAVKDYIFVLFCNLPQSQNKHIISKCEIRTIAINIKYWKHTVTLNTKNENPHSQQNEVDIWKTIRLVSRVPATDYKHHIIYGDINLITTQLNLQYQKHRINNKNKMMTMMTTTTTTTRVMEMIMLIITKEKIKQLQTRNDYKMHDCHSN